jgi:hypothetical protein
LYFAVIHPDVKIKTYFLILLFISFISCSKEWEQPVIYTVNLTLAIPPDSVDAMHNYYYGNGMKLQIRLIVKSAETIVKDEAWINQKNYHWGDSLESVTVIGKVVNLTSDTSFSTTDYPLIMSVYQDSRILYEENESENIYTL